MFLKEIHGSLGRILLNKADVNVTYVNICVTALLGKCKNVFFLSSFTLSVPSSFIVLSLLMQSCWGSKRKVMMA